MIAASKRPCVVAVLLGLVALAGCARDPFLVNRSACPAVAVPHYAGETTLFQPANSREASAIDVTATLTNLRGTCADDAQTIRTAVRFDVVAVRRDAAAARTIELPLFVAVVRSGDRLIAKELTRVQLRFAAGQARASGSGSAQTSIATREAGLPADVARRITRPRKSGEIDAATDPLAEPSVRDAVRRASFEVLVGFQLSDDDLAYNALK